LEIFFQHVLELDCAVASRQSQVDSFERFDVVGQLLGLDFIIVVSIENIESEEFLDHRVGQMNLVVFVEVTDHLFVAVWFVLTKWKCHGLGVFLASEVALS